MVTFSWLLLSKQDDDQRTAAALKQDVTWCLTEGQAFNEFLGYVLLAPQVIAHTMAAVDRIQYPAGRHQGLRTTTAWICRLSSTLCVACNASFQKSTFPRMTW